LKCRELDRERGKLEQQEKKIIADIKKMAKTGQMVGLIVTYAPINVIIDILTPGVSISMMSYPQGM